MLLLRVGRVVVHLCRIGGLRQEQDNTSFCKREEKAVCRRAILQAIKLRKHPISVSYLRCSSALNKNVTPH